MLRVAWKRFSVGIIVILVALLVVGNAYATSPTPQDNEGGTVQVFVAADLTLPALPSAASNLPSEIFVVLQAGGQAGPDHCDKVCQAGTLFLFNPESSCKINVPAVVVVTGSSYTNPLNGEVNLTFRGFEPPEPCLQLGQREWEFMVGPAPVPPDPCVLIGTSPSGVTVTYTGETARFLVTTMTTTSSSSTTTLPP